MQWILRSIIWSRSKSLSRRTISGWRTIKSKPFMKSLPIFSHTIDLLIILQLGYAYHFLKFMVLIISYIKIGATKSILNDVKVHKNIMSHCRPYGNRYSSVKIVNKINNSWLRWFNNFENSQMLWHQWSILWYLNYNHRTAIWSILY